ncbi:MAG: hypothetical protein IKJ35_07985 [Clostridia bacterium]|nr:hypothetical protein [Clostridia bacterium]
MTLLKASPKQKRKPVSLTPGQVIFGFFCLLCLCLILKSSDVAITYMNQGLLLCAKTVIPSLFPFMVLSELIVNGGIGPLLIKPISGPLKRLFGLSDAGCCAVALGLLCGFPVGAKCTVLSYDRGEISRREAERALAFSNVPSSAFLINAVGVSLWGNRRFGVLLYVAVLTTAILTGILLARLAKNKHAPSTEAISTPMHPPAVKGAKLFTEAIRSATASIFPVCAYVVFFSALLGTLHPLLSALRLPPAIHAALFCLFELSGGMSQSCALGNIGMAAGLCAFAAGWSGLSVHCQVLSVCDGRDLSFRTYFLAKIFQGIFCALFFGILMLLFPDALIPARFVIGI